MAAAARQPLGSSLLGAQVISAVWPVVFFRCRHSVVPCDTGIRPLPVDRRGRTGRARYWSWCPALGHRPPRPGRRCRRGHRRPGPQGGRRLPVSGGTGPTGSDSCCGERAPRALNAVLPHPCSVPPASQRVSGSTRSLPVSASQRPMGHRFLVRRRSALPASASLGACPGLHACRTTRTSRRGAVGLPPSHLTEGKS